MNGKIKIRNVKLWMFAGLLAAAWLVSAGCRQARAAALQKGISREVLRFHILANSDSREDQAVKLQVRDGVLTWLDETLTEEEQEDLEQMEKRLEELLPQIEKQAEAVLRKNGFDYGVSAKLGTSRFPERAYGNCTFPAGTYTALRIELGEARGHNWWCILFPKLCFLDCVHAVLPEESDSRLQSVLTEEEYESLFDPAEDEYRIAFRYF